MEKIKFGGWKNCYKLSNNMVDLIVTGDVGPRIIHFGFVNNTNILKTFPEQLGKTKQDQWIVFGGHRLWHTPEDINRTYYPDSNPVVVEETEKGLKVTQEIEPTTGIEKSIEIKLHEEKATVNLLHTIKNCGIWPIETSAWALSVLAAGGTAIIPLPPRGPHPDFILPTSSLTLWPYTDLSDERWEFGEKYIRVKQNESVGKPQKIGVHSSEGWLAYLNNSQLFIKQVDYENCQEYPDMGSNLEIFVDGEILELETLSPIRKIEPGERIIHEEVWKLIKNVPEIKNDKDVLDYVLPHL
ncbi:MAG: DUF4380 domain-containing protein [Anaerolineaceae bacterium]|nr:DUF4380 domain-containing protein [Anaerolineaceae bacterium]